MNNSPGPKIKKSKIVSLQSILLVDEENTEACVTLHVEHFTQKCKQRIRTLQCVFPVRTETMDDLLVSHDCTDSPCANSLPLYENK